MFGVRGLGLVIGKKAEGLRDKHAIRVCLCVSVYSSAGSYVGMDVDVCSLKTKEENRELKMEEESAEKVDGRNDRKTRSNKN